MSDLRTKKGQWVRVEQDDVQAGDLAAYSVGDKTLDSRTVASVDHDAGAIELFLLTDTPHGPYPIENYTYQRFVPEA